MKKKIEADQGLAQELQKIIFSGAPLPPLTAASGQELISIMLCAGKILADDKMVGEANFKEKDVRRQLS